MRSVYTSCFFILLSTYLFAQGDVEISGSVNDRNQTAIPFANAAVYDQRDSTFITGAASDVEGKFTITVKPGNYFIKITFLSYQEKILPNIVAGTQPIQLGSIVLEENAALLNEVVVTGTKSMMELHLDKRVFNVEQDLSNIGRDAAEILNNVPSVTVDVEGNVSLRGSENVRILINGRPSGLTGISSTDVLRQLQGDMIESIEVITNPSARFDAEGEVGIINIILKKNTREGVNGSVSLTGGYPANYRGSFSLSYRKDKFNLNTSYGANYRSSPGSGSSTQRYSSADTSFVYDQTQSRTRSGFSNNFMMGIDYFMNDNSTITGSFAYRKSDGLNKSRLHYRDFDENGFLVANVLRTEREEEPEDNIDVALSYRKEFKRKDHVLTIDAKRIRSNELELADYRQESDTLLIQRADNTENESNDLIQIDYVLPFGKDGKLEMGAKTATRIIENDFLLEQQNNDGDWETLPIFNNNLIYTEKIHAVYGIVGNKLKRFSYQLGLRGEFSDISTELTVSEEFNTQRYFNLFPSTHFSYQLSELRQLQVSYSYRISRPRFRDLIPFSNFTDSRVFSTGNPNLNPEYTHSIEGGYLLNWSSGSLLASAYYRYRTGVIQRIAQVENDGLTRIVPVNLATENSQGLEFNFSQSVKNIWNLNANANFYRSVIEGVYEEEDFFSDTYTLNSRITSRVTLLKKVDFQTSVNYRAPRITPQGKDLAIYSIDLGLATDVLKGKGTITASVQDLLNSRKRRRIIDDAGYYSRSEFQWRARQFLITFVYRINQRKENRDNTREDNFEGED